MRAINVEEGLHRVLGKEKLYHKLLQKFSGRKLCEEILATAKTDSGAALTACHTLRGAAANLGMGPLAQTIKHIEVSLSSNQPVDELLLVLQENIEAVEKEIEEITADKGN